MDLWAIQGHFRAVTTRHHKERQVLLVEQRNGRIPIATHGET
jgi:hypothetical protein